MKNKHSPENADPKPPELQYGQNSLELLSTEQDRLLFLQAMRTSTVSDHQNRKGLLSFSCYFPLALQGKKRKMRRKKILAAIRKSGAKKKDNKNETSASAFSACFEENSKPENQPDSRLGRDEQLFSKAMRGVKPLAAKGRDIQSPARQRLKTPPQNNPLDLDDLLRTGFDFALHYSPEYMEGFVAGTDERIVNKLRAGSYSPEAHLDLHGRTAEQAFDALLLFIKQAYQKNLRCVLVIAGRGKNSPNGIGVLRLELYNWLSRDPLKRVVLAFCTARPCDGGLGAVYVLLRKFKKKMGKIHWKRSLSHENL